MLPRFIDVHVLGFYPSFFDLRTSLPLEAFALGCPVAAADVYGAREQLGEAALLFDPKFELRHGDAMAALWCDGRPV